MRNNNATFTIPDRITFEQAAEYARAICRDIGNDKSIEILEALRARALKRLAESKSSDLNGFCYYINVIEFLDRKLAEARTIKEEVSHAQD